MNGVLIVDDDKESLRSLVRDLSQKYLLVQGVTSCEEAVDLVVRSPKDFRFAVIDHKLGKGKDGIETTKELVKICPGLFPLVFSNYPTDIKLMEHKFKAFEAGAYRYLEKTDDGPRQILKFVQEMEYLDHLRNWIAAFHEARIVAPSLLTQLDVGMDIIDYHHKVWFMNDAFRKIVGIQDLGLMNGPCAQWHGFTWFPCDGCLVNKTFLNGKPYSGVFLSPLVNRKDRELSFLKVWSQVVEHPDTSLDKTTPFAVMESVLDLTGTCELKTMPTEERLSIIANAMPSLPILVRHKLVLYLV